MYLTELTTPFKLNVKHVGGLTYLTLNDKTTVLTDQQLESLEYNLTDISHAILMARLYQQAKESSGCTNTTTNS